MDILIKLYGAFAKPAENNKQFVKAKVSKNYMDLEGFTKFSVDGCDVSGIDIASILKILNISEKSVALITLNGKISTLLSPVKENDKIKLYPFIAGG